MGLYGIVATVTQVSATAGVAETRAKMARREVVFKLQLKILAGFAYISYWHLGIPTPTPSGVGSHPPPPPSGGDSRVGKFPPA